MQTCEIIWGKFHTTLQTSIKLLISIILWEHWAYFIDHVVDVVQILSSKKYDESFRVWGLIGFKKFTTTRCVLWLCLGDFDFV